MVTLLQTGKTGLSHSPEKLFLCGLLRVSGHTFLLPCTPGVCQGLEDTDGPSWLWPVLLCAWAVLCVPVQNSVFRYSQFVTWISQFDTRAHVLPCPYLVTAGESCSSLALLTVDLCQSEGRPCLCCYPPGSWLVVRHGSAAQALPPLLCDPQILQGAMARVQPVACQLSSVPSAPKL